MHPHLNTRTGFYHYNITTMNTIRITLYIILVPIAIGLALSLTVALLYYIGYGIFRLFTCIPIVLLAAYLWK